MTSITYDQAKPPSWEDVEPTTSSGGASEDGSGQPPDLSEDIEVRDPPPTTTPG